MYSYALVTFGGGARRSTTARVQDRTWSVPCGLGWLGGVPQPRSPPPCPWVRPSASRERLSKSSIRIAPGVAGQNPASPPCLILHSLSPRQGARFLSSARGCMGGGRPFWTNPMQSDPLITEAFGLSKPTGLYGRCNVHKDLEDNHLAEIVEILPPA